MDKLEYIPGDLVYIHGSLRIINNCDGYYATYYDEDETLQEINVNVIEDIPLTPEILEKNGWKKLYEKFFEKNVNNIRLTIEFSEYIYVAINRIFIKEIHYVHELQHLLFGLGINSEMEV